MFNEKKVNKSNAQNPNRNPLNNQQCQDVTPKYCV